MTSQRWAAVKDLFDAVADLPETEQEPFLVRQSTDEDLLAEVRRLLRLGRQVSGFLSEPAEEAVSVRKMLLADQDIGPGDVIKDRFEIQSLLGFGGMGAVFLARDRLADELVALKTVRAGSIGSSERLLQEVRAARQISHPNVCNIYDLDRHEDQVFFTMAYVEGETLADRLARGPLTLEERDRLIPQICAGLAAAHDAGVLHRDLKPSNVLLSKSGDRAVLADFGLARIEGSETSAGPAAGTRAYMAPEVVRTGKASVASDIYSLGMLLDDCVARPPGAPPALERAIESCMHGRPERRPASVRAVEAMLSKPTAVPPPSRRKFWIGAAGAGAISLASVSLFPRVFRDPDRRLNAQAVLLTKIENVTGDPKLDGATALLEGQLGQSARFNLMSRGRVSELLQRMQKPLDTKVDPLTAREIALRNGGTAVVYGLLSRLASNLRLEIRIEEPGSKPDDVRASFDKQFSAAGEQDLLRQIRAAAVWIRETVGEPESDIRRHNQGPGEQTTSSWDALALYERGRELRFQSQYDEAEAMFNEALRLDPDYASALRELADMQVSIHRLRDGYATWKRAVQSSRKRQLNTRERFRLESMYFDDIGAWAEAENVNRLWMASYDSDEMPRVLLSNLRLHQYHPEEALALLLEAERKLPENLMVLAHLTPQLALAGRFEDAHRRVEKLKRLNHVRDARHYETRILAMEGRWRESLESADLAMQAAGSDYQFRHRPALVRASVLTEMGRAAEAERELLALAEEDGKAGAREARAGKLETAAYLALRRGDVMAARKLARQAVESPDFLGEFAPIVLARAGGVDDAERVLEQWGKTMPPGLPRFERQRLRLLGEIQLARRAWKPALETLRQADKLTSVRRINDSLARAYAMSGDRDEATKCYRTLVEREKYHWLTDCAEPGFGANVRKGASSLEAKG